MNTIFSRVVGGSLICLTIAAIAGCGDGSVGDALSNAAKSAGDGLAKAGNAAANAAKGASQAVQNTVNDAQKAVNETVGQVTVEKSIELTIGDPIPKLNDCYVEFHKIGARGNVLQLRSQPANEREKYPVVFVRAQAPASELSTKVAMIFISSAR